MIAVLTFVCSCDHTFTTDQWVGWATRTGYVADATCPACGHETSVTIEDR